MDLNTAYFNQAYLGSMENKGLASKCCDNIVLASATELN